MVFNPGKAALGHMMLLLTPINCDNLPGSCNTAAFYINPLHRSKIVPGSFPRLTIEKSKISHNGQGISALHYNRYLGHDYQVYLRKSNESVEVYDSEISSNTGESIYVFTPFRELNQFNISEITFMINRTRFVYIFVLTFRLFVYISIIVYFSPQVYRQWSWYLPIFQGSQGFQ